MNGSAGGAGAEPERTDGGRDEGDRTERLRQALFGLLQGCDDLVGVARLDAGAFLFVNEVARRTLASYAPYLPWMLRLSVGLPTYPSFVSPLLPRTRGRYIYAATL